MVRRLGLAGLLLVVACQGDRGMAGTGPPEAPSFVISDGATNAGNADFFFLPPLVPNPRKNPNWTEGGFNPALAPAVEFCRLNQEPATPSTPVSCVGIATRLGPVTVSGSEQHYKVDWKVSEAAGFYRLFVRAGGKDLGFADVVVGRSKELKDYKTGEIVPLKDGRNLPVKFRIESRALCADVTGTGPCTSAAVNLAVGGTVTIETDPEAPPSGVNIPAQAGGGTINVTLEPCVDLFTRNLVDIPTFGSCLSITAEPGVQLSPAATVFVCDLDLGSLGLSETQQKRLTLHRYNGNAVQALPHASGCGFTAASAGSRLRSVVRHLARGDWKTAGARFLGLLGPSPLHAIDQGGGGEATAFSDFQLALPSKITIEAGDGQTGLAGQALATPPAVRVTDLGGEPVQGARVAFEPDQGSASPTQVLTGADGIAATDWTLGAATGPQSMDASGKGIGGRDPNNGPRPGVDPFMAFPYGGPPAPESGAASGAVTLATGSVTFNADAIASQCSGANCAEQPVDLREGGTVVVTTSPSAPPSGVSIPPQGEGAPAVVVTAEPCADQSAIDNLVDIPVFGSCLTVKITPNQALAVPATVFVCDADLATGGLTPTQEKRVTLHRRDAGVVQALPHVPACGTTTASAGSLLRGMLAYLTRGEFRAAGGQFLKLIGPRPLHAIDQGGGGETFAFSDFQFALPAKMTIEAGNGQIGSVGVALPVAPTVKVTDLGGEAVAGATVKFEGDGVAATSVTTGANGEASVTWGPPKLGGNALTASGRGIGGADFNGPRGGGTGTADVDPFMAFPFTPDGESGTASGPVTLLTGSRTFNATGTMSYGTAGFRYLLVNQDGTPGFQAVGFDDSGFTVGGAPFATHATNAPAPQCTIWNTAPPATVIAGWLGSTASGGGNDLLIRKTFTLAAAGTLNVQVAIDNDVQVWLNGVDITNGLKTHEGCAVRGDLGTFVGPGQAGVNTLAVRARDRGTIGYFDIQVTLAP
jgi:hypothetical protein